MTSSASSPEGRPPGFLYRRQPRSSAAARWVLCCEQAPLPELAERFGTPLYVYSAGSIRKRLRLFDRAFGKHPHTVCYSVKANSNLFILNLLARLGCGFDVVSGGELKRVLRIDRRLARRVVFSGVGKTVEEMELALRAGILLFNVESESELSLLGRCAQRLGKTAAIALRVNPDVSAQTHPYISTGLHEHKFGIPMACARQLCARASATKSLKISGLSVHIGSQITRPEPFAEALARVAELVGQLRREGHTIDYVDAGGGLGIAYEKGTPDPWPYFARYAKALLAAVDSLRVHLLLEPGRSLVGPAGILLASVLYLKRNNAKRFVITDAAMTDLVRPALYNAYHEIVPVRKNPASPIHAYDVAGPVCETGDFFARNRKIQEVAEGDLLAILDAGAYGMVLSSNYNSRPRAAEILVEGKSARAIRRRESFADLVRGEIF